MDNILDKIIADKRLEVKSRKAQAGLEQLKELIAPMPKCRNFYKAVTGPNRRGINVIAEIKKASPSAGVIREDFNPAEIAKIYQSCQADAISVLTDEKYFQGKLDFIDQVKQAVDLPIIRKDFIVDPWQVYESRAAGADAILLIADALTIAELCDLMILAAELTLTVLLEIHDADTLLQVRSMAGFPKQVYSVLGINNRDLTTMTVDINTTGRLAGLLEDGQPFISESGIKSHDDVEKLKSFGACAVLIGQTLCQSPVIEDKFYELFGR